MLTSLEPFLSYWRTTTTRDREIVEAVVHGEHLGSPALAQALDRWPGVAYWSSGQDTGRIVLVRSLRPAPRERWWLHALLFLFTFLTVQLGGAIAAGEPVPHTYPFWHGDGATAWGAILSWLRLAAAGTPFAMALMAFLLSHEMGHYLAAKRYGINVSPPYLLPAPVELNPIGTFGAFIRLRSPVVDRRQLMDVGAAGPWVGFAVAFLLLVVGLQHSYVVPPGEYDAGMVLQLSRGTWVIGDSLLTLGVRHVLLGEGTVVLHPLAYAGCVGLVVTSINLMPLGQLDGGHILYALIGDRQRYLGVLTLIVLVVLYQRNGYWPWLVLAGLVLVLGGGRLRHPPVLESLRPLPASRIPLGWASVILFVVTFAPVPIRW